MLTPGLAADSVESHEPAWLVALGGGPGAYGVAFLDASTGEVRVTEVQALDAVLGELARHEPREALLAPEMDDPELTFQLQHDISSDSPLHRLPQARVASARVRPSRRSRA